MKKTILTTCLLLLLCFVGFGQKPDINGKRIESIKLKEKNGEQLNLDEYHTLCYYFQSTFKLDSLKLYLNEYRVLANKTSDQTHIGKAIFLKAVFFAQQNKIDSALYYFKRVSKLPNLDPSFRQNAINNTARCYRMLEKKDSAIVYLKKNLFFSKKNNLQKGTLMSYIELGNFYAYKNLSYDKSVQYLDSAFSYYKKNNLKNVDDQIILILHQLGNFEMELENYSLAKKYYFQSREIALAHNQNASILGINSSIADIYINEKKIDSALFYLNDSQKNLSFFKNKNIVAKTYRRLGIVNAQKNKHVKAIEYFDEGLKLTNPKLYDYAVLLNYKAKSLYALKKFKKSNETLNLINKESLNSYLRLKYEFYELKTKINLKKRNKDSIIFHQENFIRIKDSLFNTDKIKAISSLQTKYETQQKENEILKLKTETQQKELDLQKSKTKTNYALVSIFLVILGGGFYLRKRKKDQQLKLLEESVKSAEQEKNRIGRELHDSVASNLRKLAHDTKNKDITLSHKLLNSYESLRDLSHQLNNTPTHGELFMDSVLELMPKNNDNQQFNLKIDPPYLELTEPHSTHLYRIIQELFTNNLKHANASKTNISLVLKDNLLVLNYTDDGVGVSNLRKGTGIKSIQDRIVLLKGTIDINSNDGFSVNIKIPYNA